MNSKQIIELLEQLESEERKIVFEHLKEEFQPKKKKGPRTSKIRDAYDAITYDPQDFEELRERFDVSEVVLRQFKRFDPFPERGQVRSQIVAGKRLIWRDKDE